MRLYKRRPNGTWAWWFSFSHRGKPVRKTTGTEDKQAAQEYADRYRAALWRVARLDERPEVVWDVAAGDWLDANQGLRALSDRKDHLRWAQPHLTGMPLTAIDRPLLIELRKKKAADGVSGATVNRYLASISAVLGHAVERGWLTGQAAGTEVSRGQETHQMGHANAGDEARRGPTLTSMGNEAFSRVASEQRRTFGMVGGMRVLDMYKTVYTGRNANADKRPILHRKKEGWQSGLMHRT